MSDQSPGSGDTPLPLTSPGDTHVRALPKTRVCGDTFAGTHLSPTVPSSGPGHAQTRNLQGSSARDSRQSPISASPRPHLSLRGHTHYQLRDTRSRVLRVEGAKRGHTRYTRPVVQGLAESWEVLLGDTRSQSLLVTHWHASSMGRTQFEGTPTSVATLRSLSRRQQTRQLQGACHTVVGACKPPNCSDSAI